MLVRDELGKALTFVATAICSRISGPTRNCALAIVHRRFGICDLERREPMIASIEFGRKYQYGIEG